MGVFINKSSLYDILSAIIPGYFILELFSLMGIQIWPIENDEFKWMVITFCGSYFMGLIYKYLVEHITETLPKILGKRIKKAEILQKEKLPYEDLLEKYYIAYLNAIKGNPNSSVPVLEAQIAFL